MNTEKMYCLDKFCCLCMNKSDLKHLFEVDSDGVSHYNKLTSSIAEMNFKEMNDQRLICGECCVTLNTVYNFRQMCLRSKTNLISQLQTSDHCSVTVRVCLKDIKPELIVVKNRGESESEGSNCLEGSNPQIDFQTESYKANIDFCGSVKEECESGDYSSVNEDNTVDHVNESTHNAKVEDVDQTMIEDYSECCTELMYKIEIEEHLLEEVKEEPMSDTETPQDGSTSLVDTGAPEEPKGSGATTIGTKLTQNTEKDDERLHQCEKRQKGFDHKDYMVIHTSKKPYKCKICEKNFKQKGSLMDHMRKHNGEIPFECEICKKGFIRKGGLILHMLNHSNERPYKCEICKKGFYNKWNLNTHMKTHLNDRLYKCKICKKGFSSRGNLNAHMKTHSNDKPYECEICKKGFKHKDTVIRHMKIHSSELSYECEMCKKRFRYKDNLTGHIKTHTNEKPYECEICKKGLSSKANLNGHMKTHYDRPYKCEICKKGFKLEDKLTRHLTRCLTTY